MTGRRAAVAAALAAVAAGAAACGGGGGSTEPDTPAIGGSWAGTVSATGQSYTMELTQSGQSVAGTGVVVDALGTAGTAVTGSVGGFNVELVISFPNTSFTSIGFTGSFSSRDQLAGTLFFPITRVRDSIVFRRR